MADRGHEVALQQLELLELEDVALEDLLALRDGQREAVEDLRQLARLATSPEAARGARSFMVAGCKRARAGDDVAKSAAEDASDDDDDEDGDEHGQQPDEPGIALEAGHLVPVRARLPLCRLMDGGKQRALR
jgi:hypothetical protein